jgi:hypothetical protein
MGHVKVTLSVGLWCVDRLCGVVVSVLATGLKGRGFETGQGDGFLSAIKIRSTFSFGWEVKPEVPCHKILRHVKNLLKSHGDGQTKFSFPSPILLLAPGMSLLTGPPDSMWLPERSGRQVRVGVGNLFMLEGRINLAVIKKGRIQETTIRYT